MCTAHRDLNNYQWRVVSNAISQCSLPIFVKLVFAEICRWKSYSKPQDTFLASNVMDSIMMLFSKVEVKVGQRLRLGRCQGQSGSESRSRWVGVEVKVGQSQSQVRSRVEVKVGQESRSAWVNVEVKLGQRRSQGGSESKLGWIRVEVKVGQLRSR